MPVYPRRQTRARLLSPTTAISGTQEERMPLAASLPLRVLRPQTRRCPCTTGPLFAISKKLYVHRRDVLFLFSFNSCFSLGPSSQYLFTHLPGSPMTHHFAIYAFPYFSSACLDLPQIIFKKVSLHEFLGQQ